MAKRTEATYKVFLKRVDNELLTHRIIQDNKYCIWFNESALSMNDVRHFTQQFSVFSNLFLIAQLKKVINAVSLEEMHASKEILANEIGVIFNRKTQESDESKAKREADAENQGDPSLVNTEGTIDGGTFRFKAAHFEWLLHFAEPLGLTFDDMGKRKHGTKSTLHFCDELSRLYGSDDFNIGAGASFAVENWAAAGFWKQLINGLRRFKESKVPKLHLGFFTWHDKVEDQHAAHTQEELEELYFGDVPFNEDKFIAAGQEMLDGVAVFWDGLNEERLARNGS